MAAWLDSITFTVEIAFATDPLATPTYTDVSSYVRGIPRIFHGSTSDLSPIGPSSATVILSNRDRRFDPDYTSGPYYGNLVPMKRIKITAGLGAFSAVVFTGYVTGWPTAWSTVDGTCRIECIDGQQFLTENLPPNGYVAELSNDGAHAYWTLQDTSGAPTIGTTSLAVDDPIAEITDGTYPSFAPYALANVDATADSATAYLAAVDTSLTVPVETLEFVGRFGDTVIDEYAQVRAGVSATSYFVVRLTAKSSGAGEIGIGYSNPTASLRTSSSIVVAGSSIVADTTLHHFAVYRSGSTLYVNVDGQQLTTVALVAGTNSAISDPIPGYLFTLLGSAGAGNSPAISHVSVYTTALTTAQAVEHYERSNLGGTHEASGARISRVLDDIGWPAGLRDIDPGQTQHGPYLPGGLPAIDYLRNVENVEQGLLFRDRAGNVHFKDRQWWWVSADTGYVFSDDGGAGAVVYSELEPAGNHVDHLENIVTVSYSTVGGITRRDATSVTAYGPAPKFIDGPTLADGRTASTLAAYRLREHKDPKTRITALRTRLRAVTAAQTTIQVEKLLDLELGDVITVEYTPLQTGNQVAKKVVVWGIEHEVTPEQWYVTLFLSPAPTSAVDAPYLTLGHSTRGKIGVANGNKMPY